MDFTIIGIDAGTVKVGVAIKKKGAALAIPLATYERAQGHAETEILRLISEEKPDLIVAGLPLNEDGSENEECERVRAFCRRIERRSGAEIVFFDEYGSTSEAATRLRDTGKTRKMRKSEGSLDAVSAMVILESYMNSTAPRS